MNKDQYQRAGTILSQLQKYTEQLSRYGRDTTVDVMALTWACAERLSALQAVMAGSVPAKEDDLAVEERRELTEGLRCLRGQTLCCLESLEQRKKLTERELASLRQSKKAIRAYGGLL